MGSSDTELTYSEKWELNSKTPRLLVSITGPSAERPGRFNACLLQVLCGTTDKELYRGGASLFVDLTCQPLPTSFPVLASIETRLCEVLQ